MQYLQFDQIASQCNIGWAPDQWYSFQFRFFFKPTMLTAEILSYFAMKTTWSYLQLFRHSTLASQTTGRLIDRQQTNKILCRTLQCNCNLLLKTNTKNKPVPNITKQLRYYWLIVTQCQVITPGPHKNGTTLLSNITLGILGQFFIIFIPFEVGVNTPQSNVIYLLNRFMTS